MSAVMPLNRLRETQTLIAFWHPKPSHPFHVLIVPKKPVESFAELTADDVPFLGELMRVAQELIKEYELPAYCLVVNGGAYQDFPQLHFHLISDSEKLKADR